MQTTLVKSNPPTVNKLSKTKEKFDEVLYERRYKKQLYENICTSSKESLMRRTRKLRKFCKDPVKCRR